LFRSLLSFLPLRPHPPSTLFPYTTLFRSILGGVAVVVIALAIGGYFLIGGDDDGGSGDTAAGGSPEATVESFVDAVKNTDCDAVTDLTTENFHSTYNTDECTSDSESIQAQGITSSMLEDAEFSVGDVEEDGD